MQRHRTCIRSLTYIVCKTYLDTSRYFVILHRNIEHRLHVIASTGTSVITPKRRNSNEESTEDDLDENKKYWVDAKVSADFLKNVFKRCSATMDAWFSCIWYR